jgi:hypothetical protein
MHTKQVVAIEFILRYYENSFTSVRFDSTLGWGEYLSRRRD